MVDIHQRVTPPVGTDRPAIFIIITHRDDHLASKVSQDDCFASIRQPPIVDTADGEAGIPADKSVLNSDGQLECVRFPYVFSLYGDNYGDLG